MAKTQKVKTVITPLLLIKNLDIGTPLRGVYFDPILMSKIGFSRENLFF